MGMNYYLKKKTAYRNEPGLDCPAKLGCLSDDGKEPFELTNGWVWNNTYYPTLEDMNKNFYQLIHIGKASMGWRFFLCRYKTHDDKTWPHQNYLDKSIETLSDWELLFNDPANEIIDEDGEKISPQKMIEIITQRKGSVHAGPDGWSEINVTNDRDIYRNAERYRVINGLCVHDERHDLFGNPEHITIMPDECTYDLVWSGNSENGIIFS